MNKVCKNCNVSFETRRKDKAFCSSKCYRKYPEIAAKYNDRTNAYQKLHAREPKRKYQKLIHKCKHENRELNLTQEKCEELWNNGCHYCTKSLANETGCGLDRLDNSLGYIPDNVIPCCGSCNKMRNNILTHEEMKIAMTAVLNYRRQLWMAY